MWQLHLYPQDGSLTAAELETLHSPQGDAETLAPAQPPCNGAGSLSSSSSPEAYVSRPKDGTPPPEAWFDLPEPEPESRTEPASIQLETRGVTSHRSQKLLWENEIVFQQSILSKLKTVGKGHLAGKMATCHTIQTFKRCTSCQKQSSFYNRCELFFCPVCAPRLARERKESIEWWTEQINQPKHIVLTVRNTSSITKAYVQFLKGQLQKLRRQNVFAHVRGGFYSMEVTNEGRGWHVHFHILCDAKWVQASSLATVWGRLVGQDFAIVKVKDCRSHDYIREVTKYAVKGSQLAGWCATEIAEFIESFTGVRFFGVFGSLYGKRTEWSEWIKAIREIKPQCSCGCNQWRLLSPEEILWEEETKAGITGQPPPQVKQVSIAQGDLPLDGTQMLAWKL